LTAEVRSGVGLCAGMVIAPAGPLLASLDELNEPTCNGVTPAKALGAPGRGGGGRCATNGEPVAEAGDGDDEDDEDENDPCPDRPFGFSLVAASTLWRTLSDALSTRAFTLSARADTRAPKELLRTGGCGGAEAAASVTGEAEEEAEESEEVDARCGRGCGGGTALVGATYGALAVPATTGTGGGGGGVADVKLFDAERVPDSEDSSGGGAAPSAPTAGTGGGGGGVTPVPMLKTGFAGTGGGFCAGAAPAAAGIGGGGGGCRAAPAPPLTCDSKAGGAMPALPCAAGGGGGGGGCLTPAATAAVMAAAVSGSMLARRWNMQNDLPGAQDCPQPATPQVDLPPLLMGEEGLMEQ